MEFLIEELQSQSSSLSAELCDVEWPDVEWPNVNDSFVLLDEQVQLENGTDSRSIDKLSERSADEIRAKTSKASAAKKAKVGSLQDGSTSETSSTKVTENLTSILSKVIDNQQLTTQDASGMEAYSRYLFKVLDSYSNNKKAQRELVHAIDNVIFEFANKYQ